MKLAPGIPPSIVEQDARVRGLLTQLLIRHQNQAVAEVVNVSCMEPVVSVVVTTYQHAKFVSQCLDQILAQDSPYPFEVLVGEDDSSDGTRRVCLEYAARFPEKIRLFLHTSENRITIGGVPTGRFNLAYLLAHARGHYVCFCEGDDYWRDPHKMRLQVDALKDREDASIVFGDSILVRDSVETNESVLSEKQRRDYSALELAAGPMLPTQSVMFRNRFLTNPIPERFFSVLNADTYIFSWLASFGGALFLDGVLPCAYRLHEGGIWSGRDRARQLTFASESLIAIRAMHRGWRAAEELIDVRIYACNKERFFLEAKRGNFRAAIGALVEVVRPVIRNPVRFCSRFCRALRRLGSRWLNLAGSNSRVP